MKIRSGFVSNSSSSSFIINGVKVTNKVYEDKLEKIEWEEMRKLGLGIEPDRYYFSDDEADGYIVGLADKEPDDGAVTEITPLTEELKEKIVDQMSDIGIEINVDDVKTYVQFISNDNY